LCFGSLVLLRVSRLLLFLFFFSSGGFFLPFPLEMNVKDQTSTHRGGLRPCFLFLFPPPRNKAFPLFFLLLVRPYIERRRPSLLFSSLRSLCFSFLSFFFCPFAMRELSSCRPFDTDASLPSFSFLSLTNSVSGTDHFDPKDLEPFQVRDADPFPLPFFFRQLPIRGRFSPFSSRKPSGPLS